MLLNWINVMCQRTRQPIMSKKNTKSCMYVNKCPICGAPISRLKVAGVLLSVLNYENTRRLSGKYANSLIKKLVH